MADGDDPRPSTDEDLLDVLSRRARELSLQLAAARGELETARKRVEVYESFDESIQGAVSAALRAAYDIRVRAEQMASTLVADARTEREHVLAEIARLWRERQAIDGSPMRAAGSPRSSGAAQDPRLADLRTRARDALAGLLDEFAAETAVVAAPPALRVTPPQDLPPTPPRASLEPTDERNLSQAPGFIRRAEPEIVPSTAVPPRPTASVSSERRDEERPDQLEVVVSEVPAFARLVEVELRIRELPNVRTIYVKDYRDGVLRLVVGLAAPSTAREFGELVANIARPRIAVIGSSRATLELRLEGEASVA